MVQLATRAEEFAPVKNRSGVDSIRTSKEALDGRARAWIEGAGIDGMADDGFVEIEPGLCLQGEDLRLQRPNTAWRLGGRRLTGKA